MEWVFLAHITRQKEKEQGKKEEEKREKEEEKEEDQQNLIVFKNPIMKTKTLYANRNVQLSSDV